MNNFETIIKEKTNNELTDIYIKIVDIKKNL